MPGDLALADGGDSIRIAPLPELPEPPAGNGWTAIVPALGAVGMSAYAVLSGRLLVILLGVLGSGAAVLVAIVTRRTAVRRWRATCAGRRVRYLEHLAGCRDRATAAAIQQRTLVEQRCPAPHLAPRPRPLGWEVRLGVGRVPLRPPLCLPTPPHPSSVPWPELAAALADLVTDVATVDDCTVTLDLASAGPLGLVGPVQDTRALVRAMRAQRPDLHVIHETGSGTTREPSAQRAKAQKPAEVEMAVPTVIVAATSDDLPADVRTIGTWNPDGSLCVQVAQSTGSPGRQVVARPDRLTAAEADRLAALHAAQSSGTAAPSTRARDLPPLGVVLGTSDIDEPVILDLSESAQGGDGPHGWVVGATGTGKSQLLRRLVVGLAAHRSPDDVAFVLVDFKGGAAFDDLAGLPHVAGVLTNLDDRPGLDGVQRLIDALHAEVRRRQQLLRSVGVPDLEAYRADARHEPQPHLVVVVDEAAELLSSCPEVLDLFSTIGRVGRSLGVHLVLAAQRPEEARLRSLEGALRFRICLRTLTSADSVAVVRDPGAATLPTAPGWALLAVDGAPLRFRVSPVEAVPAMDPAMNHAARARPVWHPPLPAAVPVAVPEIEADGSAPPTSVLGLGDSPQTQWQGLVSLTLDGSAGHLAVVGAPRTGRTSTLRTVALNLAARVPPSVLHLFVVAADPGLAQLQGLPHTAAVADPADEDLVLDVVSRVAALIVRRQRTGNDGVRQLHRPADVFLLIDDWPRVRAALPDLEPLVQEIAVSGLAVGVHLILSAHRWSDLRAALRDCLGSRIELHLPDPLESLLPRGVPGPPAGHPGRGVLLSGQLALVSPDLPLPLHLLIASMPPDAEADISQRWSCSPAPVPRIHPLPSVALRPPSPASEMTLGVGSDGPVAGDVGGADRHLLVVGDSGSGRSTLLATVLAAHQALPGTHSWVVDPRGFLQHPAGAVRGARTPAQIESLLADLHGELLATLDGQRPARRTLLLVDDLDVAAALTSAGGWTAIAALLPLATDLRLTVAVGRRCAGMARAAYDPFLSAVREAGATGILLDGSPDEGPILGGVRCRPSPPGRALLVRPGQPPRPLQLYAESSQVSRRVANL